MTDRDDALGRSLAARLSEGLTSMDHATLDRLREIRQHALAVQRSERSIAWAWAAAGFPTLPGLRNVSPRNLLMIGSLLLCLTGIVGYWYSQNLRIDELADVDAGLLAGDLPIDAYLDKGLDSWLTRSQQ